MGERLPGRILFQSCPHQEVVPTWKKHEKPLIYISFNPVLTRKLFPPTAEVPVASFISVSILSSPGSCSHFLQILCRRWRILFQSCPHQEVVPTSITWFVTGRPVKVSILSSPGSCSHNFLDYRAAYVDCVSILSSPGSCSHRHQVRQGQGCPFGFNPVLTRKLFPP